MIHELESKQYAIQWLCSVPISSLSRFSISSKSLSEDSVQEQDGHCMKAPQCTPGPTEVNAHGYQSSYTVVLISIIFILVAIYGNKERSEYEYTTAVDAFEPPVHSRAYRGQCPWMSKLLHRRCDQCHHHHHYRRRYLWQQRVVRV